MGENLQRPLPEGATILWYVIQKTIGQGGFGITYLAKDSNLGRFVAIKEYLPVEFASREQANTVQPLTSKFSETFQWGLRGFMKEARTLARFTHPSIVHIHNVFEANKTAYLVMDYEPGEDLNDCLRRGECRAEHELLDVFLPILDGLKTIHAAGFIHRDITPGNIRIREQGPAVLIDFGSARDALKQRSHSLTRIATPRYAPFEQYSTHIEQGPWTDIYSLGACLYAAVTGSRPVDAMDRSAVILGKGADPQPRVVETVSGQYSPGFLQAIDSALSFAVEDRPKSIEDWEVMLRGDMPDVSVDTVDTVLVPEKREDPQPPVTQRAPVSSFVPGKERTTTPTITSPAGLLSVGLVVLLGLLLWIGQGTWFARLSREDVATVEVPAMEAIETVTEEPADIDWNRKAKSAFDQGHFVKPRGESALDYYRRALEVSPDDPEALRGLSMMIEQLVQQARLQAEAGQFHQARTLLDQARSIDSENRQLKAALVQLAAREAQAKEYNRLVNEIASDIAQSDVEAARRKWDQAFVLDPQGKALAELDGRILGLQQALQQKRATEEERQRQQAFDRLVAEVQTTLDHHQFDLAGNALRAAEEMKPEDPEVRRLEGLLLKKQTRQKDIKNLLVDARKLSQDKNYSQALSVLNKVILLDGQNQEAMGLEKTIKKAIAQAKKASTRHRVTRSIKPVVRQPSRIVCPDSGSEDIAYLLYTVKNALAVLDVSGLKQVSKLRRSTRRRLESLAQSYPSLSISTQGLTFNRSQCTGHATLNVTQAINLEGDSVIPSSSWKSFSIDFKRKQGEWLAYW